MKKKKIQYESVKETVSQFSLSVDIYHERPKTIEDATVLWQQEKKDFKDEITFCIRDIRRYLARDQNGQQLADILLLFLNILLHVKNKAERRGAHAIEPQSPQQVFFQAQYNCTEQFRIWLASTFKQQCRIDALQDVRKQNFKRYFNRYVNDIKGFTKDKEADDIEILRAYNATHTGKFMESGRESLKVFEEIWELINDLVIVKKYGAKTAQEIGWPKTKDIFAANPVSTPQDSKFFNGSSSAASLFFSSPSLVPTASSSLPTSSVSSSSAASLTTAVLFLSSSSSSSFSSTDDASAPFQPPSLAISTAASDEKEDDEGEDKDSVAPAQPPSSSAVSALVVLDNKQPNQRPATTKIAKKLWKDPAVNERKTILFCLQETRRFLQEDKTGEGLYDIMRLFDIIITKIVFRADRLGGHKGRCYRDRRYTQDSGRYHLLESKEAILTAKIIEYQYHLADQMQDILIEFCRNKGTIKDYLQNNISILYSNVLIKKDEEIHNVWNKAVNKKTEADTINKNGHLSLEPFAEILYFINELAEKHGEKTYDKIKSLIKKKIITTPVVPIYPPFVSSSASVGSSISAASSSAAASSSTSSALFQPAVTLSREGRALKHAITIWFLDFDETLSILHTYDNDDRLFYGLDYDEILANIRNPSFWKGFIMSRVQAGDLFVIVTGHNDPVHVRGFLDMLFDYESNRYVSVIITDAARRTSSKNPFIQESIQQLIKQKHLAPNQTVRRVLVDNDSTFKASAEEAGIKFIHAEVGKDGFMEEMYNFARDAAPEVKAEDSKQKTLLNSGSSNSSSSLYAQPLQLSNEMRFR